MLRQRDCAAAEEKLRRAHRLQPEDVETVMHLGITHGCQGELVEARRYFEEALRLDPTDQSARNNLAKLEQVARCGEK